MAATNTASFPSTVDGTLFTGVVCRGGASTPQTRNLNCFLWWHWGPRDSFSIICEFLTAFAQQGGMHGHRLAQPSPSQCLAQLGVGPGGKTGRDPSGALPKAGNTISPEDGGHTKGWWDTLHVRPQWCPSTVSLQARSGGESSKGEFSAVPQKIRLSYPS